MAGSKTKKTQVTSLIFFLIFTVAAGSGCVGLVLPEEQPIEPAQRTARLEDAHRADAIRDHAETADMLRHWVLETIYGATTQDLDAVWPEIVRQAEKHDLDPALVASLIAVESYYRPEVISYAGAVGLMQVIPYVGRDVALRNNIPWQSWETLLDPVSNIAIGTAYLRELIDMFDGNFRLALAAYNMGPTLLRQRLKTGFHPHGPYVTKVLGTYTEMLSYDAAQQHFHLLTTAG